MRKYSSPGKRLSGQEACFRGIGSSEYNRELVVGYPSFCLVNFWLGGCKPRVSEDNFVVT